MKKLVALILALVTMCSMISIQASAIEQWPSTSNIKTYVLSTGNNTTVYKTATSTSKYGTIYASDLITINGWSGNRLKVTYPVSYGTKTGYIDASSVLKKVNGNQAWSSFTAHKQITVYRRDNQNTTIGWIDRGDKVWVLYHYPKSGRSHVIYPVSGGYKMGWMNTSDYPGVNPTPQPSSNGNIKFVKGNYVKIGNTTNYVGNTFYTWNSNGTSYSTGSNYNYYSYVKVNGYMKDTGSTQCLAYARYIQELLYGVNDWKNSGRFIKTYYSGDHSANDMKKLITNAGSGAHIRVGNNRHSYIVLETDSNGFYYTDANGSGDRKINVSYLTWQSLDNKYGRIYMVSKYKG